MMKNKDTFDLEYNLIEDNTANDVETEKTQKYHDVRRRIEEILLQRELDGLLKDYVD